MLVNEDEYFRGQVEGDIFYGVQGPPGPAGKNAYEYAKENGYTGSESDFSRILGQFPERIDTAVQSAETAADAAYRAIDALGNTGISIVNTDSGEVISLTDSAERPLMGMKVYGKTTQNGTPTPDAPVPLNSVGYDGRVDVTVCGKNLLKNTGVTTTSNGVTFTVNSDGSVTVNGTASANTFFNVNLAVQIEEGKKYILSGCPSHTGLALYGGAYGADTGSGMTFTGFTTASSGLTPNVYIRIASGTTVNNVVVKPMIRLASNTDSTYEPYKGGSVSITTPNGLPGIPVTSGGNYTDESGQQWICDEVDFEKGVYVQRVAVHHVADVNATNNGASWKENISQFMGALQVPGITNTQCLLTHGDSGIWFDNDYLYAGIGNNLKFIIGGNRQKLGDTVASCNAYLNALNASVPIKLLYIRETPLETALSAEQLAAFTALRTNYPNTTVFNDEGADMEVKYVADTKLYIDKKFDQLAAAMLNN